MRLSLFVFVSWVFMCGLPPPAAACLSIDPEVITKRPTLPHSDHLLQDIVLFVFVFVFEVIFKWILLTPDPPQDLLVEVAGP